VVTWRVARGEADAAVARVRRVVKSMLAENVGFVAWVDDEEFSAKIDAAMLRLREIVCCFYVPVFLVLYSIQFLLLSARSSASCVQMA
jgi:hypothetical protein